MKIQLSARVVEAVVGLALVFAGVCLWIGIPIALLVLGVLVLADVATTTLR